MKSRNMAARQEALLCGEATYLSGIPCKKGHTGPRRVDNKMCMECARAKTAAWRASNPGKVRDFHVRRYAENKEAARARDRLRSKYFQAYNQVRRAREYAAECNCCRWRDLKLVWLARPDGQEVDHRIALTLGGKHCVKNLQYLTVEQHKLKTARDRAALAMLRRAA